jgi:hypothetical protein
MNTFKHLTIILFGFIFLSNISAQDVVKNIIVEHFTNTRCGICANRNPAFYNALHQNPDVIHIAYHPSAPYSSCLFSTQNKVQNDARTRFYNIFGSTPRFIINGDERSGNQVANTMVYEEFKNETTPVDLRVNIAKAGSEDIEISFGVNIKSDNTIGNVNYFIALVEDTVFYDAPNGEKEHYDVFRKSHSNEVLPTFMIPQHAGNEYNFTTKIKTESFWDLSRIYAIVILTDNNKKVVQAAKSPLYNPNIFSSTKNESELENNITIYPNPVQNELFFTSKYRESIQKVTIKNQVGQNLFELHPKDNPSFINTDFLTPGTYFLEVTFQNKKTVQKFIKI